MITTNLGQAPAYARMPFQRPRPADPNLMPHLLRTRFSTHLRPAEMTLPAAQSFQPTLPRASGYMRPGVASGYGYGPQRGGMPARRVPGPTPGPTAGAFGHAHPYQAPYTTAVTRALMPFRQDPRGIRGGVLTAPDLIRRMHAPGYPYVAQPAGYFEDKAY